MIQPPPYDMLPPVPPLAVCSNDITGEPDNILPVAQVHNLYGRGGQNRSPHLCWSDAPEHTRSYAVTCVDPDAPGGLWWHWCLVDIPVDITELPTESGSFDGWLPEGGMLPEGGYHLANDFGTRDYGGAAPPPGARHRYVFAVHALSVPGLPVAPDTPASEAAPILHAHTLARGLLVATYQA